MSIADIRSAIGNEMAATPEYYDFKVRSVTRDGKLWVVSINSTAVFTDGGFANVVLDESFEGAAAWWHGPPKGSGEVLTVLPEEEQIVLRNVQAMPPGKDGLLRLYPPRYLNALHACWLDNDWASRAWQAHQHFAAPVTRALNVPSGQSFRWLRRSQRQALQLPGISPAFLWGPPGTGKTTTLGVMMAEYLYANPRTRVLLLSTTNHAVDQAIVAVDKALESANRDDLRKVIARIGTRFGAAQYANREHLLRVLDKELVRQLAEAEAERPEASDITAYSAWMEKVESLRRQVRDQSLKMMSTLRLAAMTTTRAVFSMAELRLLPTYDLVVFDEASQVGLAHALALMPLGSGSLFAGDPSQLAPIVRSPLQSAQHWLGRSPFALKPRDGESLCFLDEQSRMAEPICKLVSHVFYHGALKVAKRANSDSDWLNQRQLSFDEYDKDCHLAVCRIDSDGQWSQNYRGPIRFDSAERIVEMVANAARQGLDIKLQLIVLTPFRAQRALIRQRLSKANIKGVKVSTVHRAQGSEVPVVLFDPVEGSNAFLMNSEAHKLVNVALSRAQAKVIVFLSAGDLANPLFKQVAAVTQHADVSNEAAPIAEYLHRADFPLCALNQVIRIGRHEGKILGTRNGGKELEFLNVRSGEMQYFVVDVLRGNCTGSD